MQALVVFRVSLARIGHLRQVWSARGKTLNPHGVAVDTSHDKSKDQVACTATRTSLVLKLQGRSFPGKVVAFCRQLRAGSLQMLRSYIQSEAQHLGNQIVPPIIATCSSTAQPADTAALKEGLRSLAQVQARVHLLVTHQPGRRYLFATPIPYSHACYTTGGS